MPAVIVRKDEKSLLRERGRKRVVSARVFHHSVGDLHHADEFSLSLPLRDGQRLAVVRFPFVPSHRHLFTASK